MVAQQRCSLVDRRINTSNPDHGSTDAAYRYKLGYKTAGFVLKQNAPACVIGPVRRAVSECRDIAKQISLT